MAEGGKAESLPPQPLRPRSLHHGIPVHPLLSPATHTHTHMRSCSSANISVHLKDLLNAIMIQNKNTFAALSSLLQLSVVTSAEDVKVISL